jgi:integrase/recombinase XerD
MPKIPDDLASKILEAEDIRRMTEGEPKLRNQMLLRVLYAAGIRASEASGLRWQDVQPRGDTGQITVLGKGSKTRSIMLPESVWKALQTFRPKDAKPEDPVFTIKNGTHMSRNHISIVVARAARRAGTATKCSAHGLRHNHATHALDNGASVALIKETLGHSSLTTTSRYLHIRPSESSSKYLNL